MVRQNMPVYTLIKVTFHKNMQDTLIKGEHALIKRIHLD